jgi:DNA polymerase-3 subunit delta
MAIKKDVSYEEVVRDIQSKNYKPIYYLMGDESYYIDRIADYIASSVLTEEERSFNQIVLYGGDTDVRTIINTAKSFPMGAKYQVVIVKEAQSIRNIEELAYYVQKPLFSTILVVCHKNGTLDKRKKLAAEIQKVGVLFESKRLRDYQLPTFIVSYLKRKSATIDQQAALIIADHVGSDLNRIASELDKLVLALPKGQKLVTADLIESNIGISKDFNDFELLSAIVSKNIFRANQIAKYFDSNPKAYPLQRTLPFLFGFFSNLMVAFYAPQRSGEGIANWLEMPTWQVERNYLPAMQNYTAMKVLQIVEAIRRTDAKSKGIDNSIATSGDLLEELLFFIFH